MGRGHQVVLSVLVGAEWSDRAQALESLDTQYAAEGPDGCALSVVLVVVVSPRLEDTSQNFVAVVDVTSSRHQYVFWSAPGTWCWNVLEST